MAKRQKLSIQQKRRVARSQQKKLSANSNALPSASQLGEIQQGIVISRYGEQADIADEQRRIYRCYLRQHLGSCVSGDRVSFRAEDNSQSVNHRQPDSGSSQESSLTESMTDSLPENTLGGGVIEVIAPRKNSLKRPSPHGDVKTVVANVDQIYVVIAPLPEYSSLLLDRYLVACELSNIEATILLNKIDLIDETQATLFSEQLSIYQGIGYQCINVSTKTDASGSDELLATMSGRENILVGQSGVGKSSIINSILPGTSAHTQEVSSNSKLGTHTTTASRLYFLPGNGHIIDSPGIREFGLWHLEPDQLLSGFRDLNQLSGHCKFRNCRHLNEKGCAIIEATRNNEVSIQRVENYQKIYQQLMQQASR